MERITILESLPMNNLSFEFVFTSTKRVVSFLCSSSRSSRGFFGARALSMFRIAVLSRRIKRPRRNSTLDEYVFTRNPCFYEYNKCKIVVSLLLNIIANTVVFRLYGIPYELVERQIVFVIGIHITEIHSFFLFVISR